MILQGKTWKFGNDIDTDVIIPVQFTGGTDLDVFGKHCMEGIDPHFSEKVGPGDIIVAGTNFGCGSSREPAPLAIKASGISCIIAKSFARIFLPKRFQCRVTPPGVFRCSRHCGGGRGIGGRSRFRAY